jgi:hypothetical protein
LTWEYPKYLAINRHAPGETPQTPGRPARLLNKTHLLIFCTQLPCPCVRQTIGIPLFPLTEGLSFKTRYDPISTFPHPMTLNGVLNPAIFHEYLSVI